MALQYGVNITASDMRNILEQNDKQQNGVRSWRQLFGNASLGYESQADALKSYYGDAMAQAYKANFERQNAVLGAGLSVGATKDLLSSGRQELQETYNNYIKNYASNAQSIGAGYGEEVKEIDNALTERSTNFANLYNSAYKYLSNELYGSTFTTEGDPIYEKDGKEEKLTGYENISTDYLDAQGLDWLKDNKGNLLSWNDAKLLMMNPDGSLNKKGTEFFDAMFNARPEEYLKNTGESTKLFDAWLSEEDNDLYNWLGGQDLFNHTFAGTNLGTANVLTGRESTDDTYAAYQYVDNKGMDDFAAFDVNDEDALNSLDAKNSLDSALAAQVAYDNEPVLGPRGYYPRSQTYSSRDPNAYKQEGLRARAEQADKKAKSDWQTYKTATANKYKGLDEFFKSKLSSNMYTQFQDANKNLLNEYNNIVEQMENETYAKKGLIEHYKDVYNRLYKAMTDYINSVNKGKRVKKTSGF